MEKKQWVQHISGQGEKWKLSGKPYNQEGNKDWQVIAKNDPSPFNYHYLPKSEYRLCDPPGPQWEPVDNGFIDVKLVNEKGEIQFGVYRARMTGIERLVSE